MHPFIIAACAAAGKPATLTLDKPTTLTLDSAKALHTNLRRDAEALMRRHSHPPFRSSTHRYSVSHAPPSSPIFNPVIYGADPTGVKDSTAGLHAALHDLLALANKSTSPTMASGIADLGGATLDLAGGQYLISKPLVIPTMVGNIHLRDGTLRASTSFPPAMWLVSVGNATTCKPMLPSGKPDHQASCNEGVTLSNMLFDAAHVAAGGVYAGAVMGTVITSGFFTGFTQIGISIEHGHEVMISETWLAACYWSDAARCHKGSSATSIGVRIDGNDHYMSNVIVFDYTGVGVEVLGAANLLEAVHTWNGGGVGIALGSASSPYGAHQNRLLGCYLDYNTLDMYDPSSVVVESTFFLATHAIIHAVQGNIDGLVMRYNSYTTAQSVVLDGTFTSAKGVVISDEMGAAKSTRSTKEITQSIWSAKPLRFDFDFADKLLFGWVEDVKYTVTMKSGFVHHVARPSNGTSVAVEVVLVDALGTPAQSQSATVRMTVAQAI